MQESLMVGDNAGRKGPASETGQAEEPVAEATQA
jgi:hypothetical protein